MKQTIVTIISRWTDNLVYSVTVAQGWGETVEDALHSAFNLTNQDDRPLRKQVCSTSVGDLMIVNGEYWLVDRSGMKKLDEQQAIAWQQIDARDAHDGWDWCVQQGVITAGGQIIRK